MSLNLESIIEEIPSQAPPVRRGLNPKLTAKRPYPQGPPPLLIETDPEQARKEFLKEVGALDIDSARSNDTGKENPKGELMHVGYWIRMQYKLGRPIKFTGMWSCCGHPEKDSLYCDSLEAREDIIQQQEMDKQMQMAEREYMESNKKTSSKKKYELSLASGPSPEEAAMNLIGKEQSSYNAPMIMSWILKHVKEEQTLHAGLKLLLNHVQTGEGCKLMHTHGACFILIKATKIYRSHEEVQLLIVQILRQFLDCNFTRDACISTNIDLLSVAFNILHVYMKSHDHVEQAVQCIMQCSRSELCRTEIIERKMYIYLTIICKRYSKYSEIIRPVLKTFNWITTTPERIVMLCGDKAVSTVINCMKRHMNNADVLGPGMLFLTRASASYPLAMKSVLKMEAVPIIIGAMKALYSNDILQLEGLKMIQQLSKTSEGWKQIQDTRGGWQTICQGTTLGNALLHDLQGSFHNPGWCVGDTPNMPILDRSMVEAQKILNLRSATVTDTSNYWNAPTLNAYMGLGGKHMTLAVNTDRTEAYFQLIKTLDLLPQEDEEKEYWFMRINDYEKENDIQLDDMLETILGMKKKEQDRVKKEEKEKEFNAKHGISNGEEISKQVYVNGDLVTTQLLDAKDIAMDEQLEGVM